MYFQSHEAQATQHIGQAQVIPQSHNTVALAVPYQPLLAPPAHQAPPMTALLLQEAAFKRDSSCARIVLTIVSIFSAFSLVIGLTTRLPDEIRRCQLIGISYYSSLPGNFLFLLGALTCLVGIKRQSTNFISFSIYALSLIHI
eukprot:TRINITY_DN7905_c1_g1_i1.p1 TRINITY_DN7905_c1_g1~~TRINITY_DN7905_c1_g1_i1.p1  ORF type:complete len:143 (-),score=27.05 TRINITY_DN7905_c1_g1_i1:3-431(-)